MGEAQELVAAVRATFLLQDDRKRPIHSHGICAKGQFKPSAVANQYCIADHFDRSRFKLGSVPVAVRFSNAAGGKAQPDGWSDVRGMATRFFIDQERVDASASDPPPTDLIAMTLGEFFARTPQEFLKFCESAQPVPVTRQSIFSKIVDMLKLKRPMPDPYIDQKFSGAVGALDYANRHRQAQPAVMNTAMIGAPESYARANYYAVHTFIITGPGPENRERYVRFQWQPIAGVKVLDIEKDPRADAYLQDELRSRLKYWPAQFRLLMTIGEIGDAIDDPTVRWPERRVRVVMGTMTLSGICDDKDCERISFNPCRLAEGIEQSGDPILKARHGAYEESRKKRGGTACPFYVKPEK